MFKRLFFASCLLTSPVFFAGALKKSSPSETQKTYQQVNFTENKGQISDQFYRSRPDILFGGIANNMVFHLRNNGISYQLKKVEKWKELNTGKISSLEKNEPVKFPSEVNIYRLDVNWLNSNSFFQVQKGTALPGYSNYYLPSCPYGATEIKSYTEITYKNIYNGIDLKWYEKTGALKYDYIVAPHADYKQIQLELKGAEEINLNSKGELVIHTPLGDIIEQAPVVKQNDLILKSKWVITNNIISFEIENIDPDKAFIIDPAVRTWGTYYGGSGSDQGLASAQGINGTVYLAGSTSSGGGTLIATVGSHQTNYAGGLIDAYVAKFDSAGVRQWSTYYGGSGEENGPSCAADGLGNVYVAGFTNTGAANIIATAGSHQSVFGSGGYDAYLVKFNANGLRQWGTYYGGSLDDYGASCATDVSGNVYLSGYTGSNTGTVIATVGSHQPNLGGSYDAFLVQFNSAGVRQWATYYGGNGNDYASCVASAGGNVYITGYTDTNAGNAIASPGSHQTTNGGVYDAYLVKFNSSGVRQWGTYYGAAGDDEGLSCTGDAAGNVYIAGYTSTNTNTAIATDGSHQPNYGGGGYDAFLGKFNALGQRQWGTYYGGSGNDFGYSCITDISGGVFLAGYTGSSTGTIIATTGSPQDIFGGGSNDAFLVNFNGTSGEREWGTYYGGSVTDQGYSCSTNQNGVVYLTGNTNSNGGTAIATAGSHQTSYGGGLTDGFMVQLFDCNIPAAPTNTTPIINQTICENTTTTLYVAGTGTISWYATPSSTNVLGTGTTFITPTLSAGTYSYYVEAVTCTTSLARTLIVVTVETCIPTGITTVSGGENYLKIYPNPNSGDATISSSFELNLNLINETGQLIRKIELNSTNNYLENIENLKTGIYFIYGTNGVNTYSRKIIVLK